MNAKTRYRQRMKLQVALLEVFELLDANVNAKGIPADQTTALMAWEVARQLVSFTKMAGLDTANLPDKPDHSRFLRLKIARLKEKAKRGRRRRK